MRPAAPSLPLVALLLVATSASAAGPSCSAARKACTATATSAGRACDRNCKRLPDLADAAACRSACRTTRRDAQALCRSVVDPCAVACPDGDPSCGDALRTCLRTARTQQRACRGGCDGRGDIRCFVTCDRERATAETGCGFVASPLAPGAGEVPTLPMGQPADLPLLLDSAEQAIVAAADDRAATLRSRPLRLWVGRPGAAVTVTQTKHAFAFGFPIDFREFENAPADLAFYESIAVPHTNFVVAETSLKWRVGRAVARGVLLRPRRRRAGLGAGPRAADEGAHAALGQCAAVLDRQRHPELAARTVSEREPVGRRAGRAARAAPPPRRGRRRPLSWPDRRLGRDQRDAQPLRALVHGPAGAGHRERHVRLDPRRRSGRDARVQ